MITLSDALRSGRLSEFVEQEEARGVGPVNKKELDTAIKVIATQPLSEDQTSRSSSGDCSTEK